MNVFDLLLDDELDLKIQGGDLVKGESTLQHQALLLLTHSGEWRANPTVGAALDTYLLDEVGPDELRQQIRRQFALDGMAVGRIEVTDGQPEIEASYE